MGSVYAGILSDAGNEVWAPHAQAACALFRRKRWL
jgi:hypothetical protein